MNNRIAELRKENQLTQKELAKAVNVRVETICRLEKGLYNPSLQLAFDIASLLTPNCNILDVFQLEKPKQRPDTSTNLRRYILQKVRNMETYTEFMTFSEEYEKHNPDQEDILNLLDEIDNNFIDTTISWNEYKQIL